MRENSPSSNLLPHDKEAEQGVLGAIIHNNDALSQAVEMLQPEYFFSPAHRELFKAMLQLSERQAPIDEITLGTYLRDRNQLEPVGGLVYIAELVDLTPVASNVGVYAEIVRQKHQLRSLIQAAMEIAAKGRDTPDNAEELIHQAEGIFIDLANSAQLKSYAHLKDLLNQSFETLEGMQDRDEELLGLPTGFAELDKYTNGLQKSELIIVAARPSMGKTSFAISIARYAAMRSGVTAAIFSLEMSKEALAMRLLCAEAAVDSQRVRLGKHLEEHEWDKLATAAGTLSEAQIFIDETPDLTPMGVKAIARRIQAEHGLGLIVVDYLQLMRASHRTDNREQEIAEISRGLKAVAKGLNVPVLACAQLNRGLETRAEKRPVLSDLRESGAIEQDADLVMFIYRDEVYNPDTEDAGVAEIHIAKHRNGPITTTKHGIRLAFIPKFTKFAALSLRYDDEGPYN